jgi:hypothetical protein
LSRQGLSTPGPPACRPGGTAPPNPTALQGPPRFSGDRDFLPQIPTRAASQRGSPDAASLTGQGFQPPGYAGGGSSFQAGHASSIPVIRSQCSGAAQRLDSLVLADSLRCSSGLRVLEWPIRSISSLRLAPCAAAIVFPVCLRSWKWSSGRSTAPLARYQNLRKFGQAGRPDWPHSTDIRPSFCSSGETFAARWRLRWLSFKCP